MKIKNVEYYEGFLEIMFVLIYVTNKYDNI